MKHNYFVLGHAPDEDGLLRILKLQGRVPMGCLLAGSTAMEILARGDDPCEGCKCPRRKCGGREVRQKSDFLDLYAQLVSS